MSMSVNGNERRRVVVTGIGMVTPLGLDREASWEGIAAGRSGAGPVTLFDVTDVPVKIACEVKGFDPEIALDRKTARRTDRFAHFAVAAAREAVADAELEIEKHEPHRIGTSVAAAMGGLTTMSTVFEHLFEKGADRMNPFWITALIPNMAAGMVSIELGARGPCATSCTACAASAMAIGDAALYIREGMADVMLAGGSEAVITPLAFGAFSAIRAMSLRNDEPERASRPFDGERAGFVMGEGAALLVLEELGHAERRGAKIYAELLGYGLSADAEHVTAVDPTGENPARAMLTAIEDAGLEPADIGYVNAHATSTPLGDSAETRVLKLVFGEEEAHGVPVSSTKSMTGHMIGAAGAAESAITVLAMCRDTLPPTINLEVPDAECDLDYVPNESRHAEIAFGLSNGFGFGGHNACLVFGRWDGPNGRRGRR
jgi:3-oxoacyl-[acyl-carrier-protein] synthase II